MGLVEKPDMCPRKACGRSPASTRGSRSTAVRVRHLRQVSDLARYNPQKGESSHDRNQGIFPNQCQAVDAPRVTHGPFQYFEQNCKRRGHREIWGERQR